MKNKKKEQEKELTVSQKVGLFFRNLFKMPAKNGQRRFVKNVFTGKWEWTRGFSPMETTLESLSPSVLSPDKPKVRQEEKEKLSPFIKQVAVEPYRVNRFKLEFPDIKEYLIQDVKQLSDDQVMFTVVLIQPVGDYDIVKILDAYKKRAKDSRKRKLKKDVVLSMLDPVGVEVSKLIFKNVSLSSVSYFDEVSYASDGLLYARVIFTHEGSVFN